MGGPVSKGQGADIMGQRHCWWQVSFATLAKVQRILLTDVYHRNKRGAGVVTGSNPAPLPRSVLNYANETRCLCSTWLIRFQSGPRGVMTSQRSPTPHPLKRRPEHQPAPALTYHVCARACVGVCVYPNVALNSLVPHDKPIPFCRLYR